MKAVIIYNSLTGTTEKAAHRIASELRALRVDATPDRKSTRLNSSH